MMDKQILAAYDEEGIFVYQAFKDVIVDDALRLGSFGKGFNRDRMTWLKPSFGWILYRSGYATKRRQTRILRIKISHEAFREILMDAVPTSFSSELYRCPEEWELALQHSEVRYQWDPERDLGIRKLEQRAIQLGIRGSIVQRYVDDWILQLEDVTELARFAEKLSQRFDRDSEQIKKQILSSNETGISLLEERAYSLPIDLKKQMSIS